MTRDELITALDDREDPEVPRACIWDFKGARDEDLEPFLKGGRIDGEEAKAVVTGPLRRWAGLWFTPDLKDANLEGRARLSLVNMAGANLECANPSFANLKGATLVEANLGRAVLIGADLSGADLRGAILRGGYLNDVNLSGADLTGADLTGAKLDAPSISDKGGDVPYPLEQDCRRAFQAQHSNARAFEALVRG